MGALTAGAPKEKVEEVAGFGAGAGEVKLTLVVDPVAENAHADALAPRALHALPQGLHVVRLNVLLSSYHFFF